MDYSRLAYLTFFLSIVMGCKEDKKTQHETKKIVSQSSISEKEVLIQPFSDLPRSKVEYVQIKLKEIYPSIKVLSPVSLPTSSFYKPRNRYRADSIILYLKRNVGKNQLVVGITTKDISTTKGEFLDWGVMGLGFMYGPSCVVSSFRLKNNDQLFKTVIHELGHNFGLPHCPVKTCFMRDAEGKNRFDEESSFCTDCKKVLTNNGWKLD